MSHRYRDNDYRLALIVWGLTSVFSVSSEAADAPPHNYLDLGPHYIVAPGIGAVTEYRDLLLNRGPSGRFAVTATYRGWSVSGIVDQAIDFSTTRSSELLVTYSHKLPYVDLHIGVVSTRIGGSVSDECAAASLTASSNSLSFTKLDLEVQNNFSGTCRSIAIGATQELWRSGIHQIDLHVSSTTWNTDALKTDGRSVRLMGRSKLDGNQSVHYHIGYIDSNLKHGPLQSKPSGATFGLNYVWEFR